MGIDVFEAGDTVQFTFVSSVAPDSAPVFSVVGIDKTSVVASFSSVQSDSTHYYALYTLPTSEGLYVGRWDAVKTFQGSARTFVRRFLFRVNRTKQP